MSVNQVEYINPQVSLHILDESFAAELLALLDANRAFLHLWLKWPDMPTDLAQTQAFLRQRIEKITDGQGPQYLLKIGGDIRGLVGFHELNSQTGVGSIGYWLAENCNGKGFATMAATKLIEIGFEQYGLNQIEIKCCANNMRSRALAERLGFVLKTHLPQKVVFNGEQLDLVIYIKNMQT